MTNIILEELNQEIGQLADNARRSLVQIQSGGQGGGAGTIWHPDGLVLTNAHVVRGGPLRIILPDGSTQPAKVLGHNSEIDVAAISVDASNLPAIELGDSGQLKAGHWVMALGYPWGVAGAATGGVIIGMGSDLPEMPYSGREWIAVGLHLRPGHSGGPLVDAQGRLVGINTMMVGPEVGLAVPVHVVKRFLKEELGTSQNLLRLTPSPDLGINN